MTFHSSHTWVRRGDDVVECALCSTRIGWDGARQPCAGKLDVRAKLMIRLHSITHEEAMAELERSMDSGGEGGYAIHHPGTTHGRDGRRRNGL